VNVNSRINGLFVTLMLLVQDFLELMCILALVLRIAILVSNGTVLLTSVGIAHFN